MKIEDIQKMRYKDLKDFPMDFGKAKLGMKFSGVVKDVRYVTWFTNSYKTSQKATHYRLLHFIQLHVEQLERNVTLKPKAKAKSAPYPTTKTSLEEIASDIEDLEEPDFTWEQVGPSEVNPLSP